MLAEGLQHRHPGDQEGEALEGHGVGLHQPAPAVDAQRHERQVLQHLTAAPLGDGELGLGLGHRFARAPGLGSGAGSDDEARARQHEDRDRQHDHRDDHARSVADLRPRHARPALAAAGPVIGSPR